MTAEYALGVHQTAYLINGDIRYNIFGAICICGSNRDIGETRITEIRIIARIGGLFYKVLGTGI